MNTLLTLNGKDFVTLGFVTKTFGINRKTFYEWKARGFVPDPIKIGKHHLYERQELEARLAQGEQKP
jgi:hypothetical protein